VTLADWEPMLPLLYLGGALVAVGAALRWWAGR
jgi:hypothetical protein